MHPGIVRNEGVSSHFGCAAAVAVQFPSSRKECGSFPDTRLSDVSFRYVWHTDPASYSSVAHALTADDIHEFKSIRNAATRRRSLATRGALRLALSEAEGGHVHPSEWVFARDAFGKPRLCAPRKKPYFSCSHTPFVSVVAVSPSREIGVDVATPLPEEDDPSLIEEFFSPGERQAVGKVPERHKAGARARLWALKEAVVKMLGTGLALDVSKLEFEVEADHLKSSQAPEIHLSGMRLATWSIPNNSQSLSVALAVRN